MKKTVNGGQQSLNISFDEEDDVFAIFDESLEPQEKHVVRSSKTFENDLDRIIDFSKVKQMYPCDEALKWPVGKQRDRHCAACPECKRMLREMDAKYVPGNKWLDQSMNADKRVSKKEDIFDDI